VEVPTRVYHRFLHLWPRSAWSWAEPVPGRRYKVHYLPWEAGRVPEAEELLREVRGLLKKKG